ncbi:conserved protein of unknown function [Blastococcus saxobsidens DD2]|uniref:Dienelactone hydrolase domain-containing protein n=1 Tax=Blastococcus saxobsidens (strain DD2) TaxID=1146883 RepID=H6RLP5_BLASD|nr:conserved protein of unknown function [Blastococcus saxobsidens DD2]
MRDPGDLDPLLERIGDARMVRIAGDSRGAPMQRMPLPPARRGSTEALVHDAVTDPSALVVFPRELPRWLGDERAHRAVEVVHHPRAERWGNDVPTVLGRRYDEFCRFDESRALTHCTTSTHQERRWRPVPMPTDPAAAPVRRTVEVPSSEAALAGDLVVPRAARGVVLFAHGSGSSRHSPRNQQVAAALHDAGFGTLLLDLLTEAEEQVDARTRELRFDIGLLAGRLTDAADWLGRAEGTAGLSLATFGASTGAAAALITAADRPSRVAAVISRGGRPDLAGDALGRVRAPTLLVVGGADAQVLDLNREAAARLTAEHEIAVVPGATHLFPEPGALEQVIDRTVDWLGRWLPSATADVRPCGAPRP